MGIIIYASTGLRAVGFLGSQLSILAAIVLGGLPPPMLVTSLLYLINMGALMKTSDLDNQPKENPMVTEEMRSKHKAMKEAVGLDRMLRVCVNQLEQFPMALVTLWGAFHVADGSSLVTAAFGVYALFRVTFAIFYLQSIRPGRQLSFGLSLLTVLCSVLVAARASL